MDQGKLKELEAKLRDMFELDEKTRTKQEPKKAQPVKNFVIRRRKGQQDKRIIIETPS